MRGIEPKQEQHVRRKVTEVNSFGGFTVGEGYRYQIGCSSKAILIQLQAALGRNHQMLDACRNCIGGNGSHACRQLQNAVCRNFQHCRQFAIFKRQHDELGIDGDILEVSVGSKQFALLAGDLGAVLQSPTHKAAFTLRNRQRDTVAISNLVLGLLYGIGTCVQRDGEAKCLKLGGDFVYLAYTIVVGAVGGQITANAFHRPTHEAITRIGSCHQRNAAGEINFLAERIVPCTLYRHGAVFAVYVQGILIHNVFRIQRVNTTQRHQIQAIAINHRGRQVLHPSLGVITNEHALFNRGIGLVENTVVVENLNLFGFGTGIEGDGIDVGLKQRIDIDDFIFQFLHAKLKVVPCQGVTWDRHCRHVVNRKGGTCMLYLDLFGLDGGFGRLQITQRKGIVVPLVTGQRINLAGRGRVVVAVVVDRCSELTEYSDDVGFAHVFVIDVPNGQRIRAVTKVFADVDARDHTGGNLCHAGKGGGVEFPSGVLGGLQLPIQGIS